MGRKNIELSEWGGGMKVLVNKLQRFEDVEKVYSGRPGCACGCRGNYTQHIATMKKIYNKFKAGRKQGLVYSWKDSIKEFIAMDNPTNTRTWTLYLRGKK